METITDLASLTPILIMLTIISFAHFFPEKFLKFVVKGGN